MKINKCPVCSVDKKNEVFHSTLLPEYALLYSNTYNQSLNVKRVEVNYVSCENCGFLYNNQFKQLDYKHPEYDVSRAHSSFIENYYDNVFNKIKKYINNISKSVELGAGDCKFSEIVKKNVGCDVSAFDPTYEKRTKKNGINKYNDYYDKNYTLKPDLVFFRHVLEHISDVKNFIKNAVHENPKYVFIEIPCSEFVKKGNWHYFFNEHCSYFSKESLTLLMHQFSYKPLLMEYVFNNENIIALFEYKDNFKNLEFSLEKEYKFNMMFTYEEWKNKSLSNYCNGSIIWGAAAKGVVALNLLELGAEEVKAVVDINPNIDGKYIPGTGIKILNPKHLENIMDADIYIMNSVYKNEITKKCEEIGYKGKIKIF